MTDKPIIFSGPMVCAILQGRKTQTRRVLKPQPEFHAPGFSAPLSGTYPYRWLTRKHGPTIYAADPGDLARRIAGYDGKYLPCRSGDRLWVREAWQAFNGSSFGTSLGRARVYSTTPVPGDEIQYRADGDPTKDFGRYRSPIHMPRWASRLSLIVTDVRVQRLQEISEENAKDEGCEATTCANITSPKDGFPSHRSGFAILWNSLNAKRGYGWDENPWVVAITFRPYACNIDAFDEATAIGRAT